MPATTTRPRRGFTLIEMVVAKASPEIAALYDAALVPASLRPIGEALRGDLARTERTLLQVTGHAQLLEENPVLRRSIDVRNPYVDPLSLMQVSLLRRQRERADGDDEESRRVADALATTLSGVAQGLRTTG